MQGTVFYADLGSSYRGFKAQEMRFLDEDEAKKLVTGKRWNDYNFNLYRVVVDGETPPKKLKKAELIALGAVEK